MAFDLAEYLRRVKLDTAVSPSVAGLQALHEAQAHSIPFENIDVRLGRGIDLDPNAIFEKLVRNHRGGYCFELNGLFANALESIGFQVHRVLARVAYNRSEPGPRTHEALIVTVDGSRWLSDVGFGGPGLRSPIPFAPNAISEQFGDRFRIEFRDQHFALQKYLGEQWVDLYLFTLEEARPTDLEMSNFWTSSHPTSIFRQNLICTIPAIDGRRTLRNSVYATADSNSELSNSEIADVLTRDFDLHLDGSTLQALASL